jgi:DNA-binding response OmpR family regulator
MDGFELVDFLQSSSKHRKIPVVLLSAKSTEEAKIEGLNVGADDYLMKPFSAAAIRAVINSRLKKSNR